MKSGNTDNKFAEQEEQTRQLLAPLQELSPPSELRERLRRTTAANVQQDGHSHNWNTTVRGNFTQNSRSVWTRKIAIPLPLAALFILVFVSLIGHNVVQSISKTTSERAMSPVQEIATTPSHPIPQTQQQTTNQPDQLNGCSPKAWREETFIAGLGPIATRNYISCEREEP